MRRFCSKACTADNLRRPVAHSCERCGVTFIRVPTKSGRYCSKECAYAARRKEDPTARRMVYRPGHPLTLNSPYIPEHRVILYAEIGPGSHSCHHCGVPVQWLPGGKCGAGVLIVDHLDRNPLNNSLDNLAPSCQRCNILNSERAVQDHESFRVTRKGTRLRGEARSCEWCGSGFVAHPDSRPNRGRFCSRSCARRAQGRISG